MIKTIHELRPSIDKLRNEGVVRGANTGFKSLDSLYSIKEGTFTTILAEPGHGKSEFILELAMNQAERFGKRSLVCSPETGSPEEVVAELFHKYTGKHMLKSSPNSVDDKAFYNFLAWLDEWFILVDTDEKSYSIQELFDLAEVWEHANNKKVHIIIGEPYNELNHELMQEKFGARQDLYIEDLMGELRRMCKKTKKHFFLSLHPSSASAPITQDGITYYPKPLPRQAAGGQALFRKAMTWITLWRPPFGLKDKNGRAYFKNEVQVYIDKAKPKGVSTKGMINLFFNWSRNRYYEYAYDKELYAFQFEKHEPPVQQKLQIPIITYEQSVPQSEAEELPF